MVTVYSRLPRWFRPLSIAALIAALGVSLVATRAAEMSAPQESRAEGSGNPVDPLARGPDPVMAEVDGHAIHLSEVGDTIRALPGGGVGNSFETLYPIVVARLVERTVLALRARSDGLDHDPTVQRDLQEAQDRVLENAYLRHEGMKNINEGTLLARYATEISGKPGPEEVHALVILVATEAEAGDLIARLAKGADFAAVAHKASLDASASKGGDLGFVTRDAISSELGAALFELRPGEVTPYPVRTAYGWFVLKDAGRRRGPAPSFAEEHEHLTTELLRAQVLPLAKQALSTAVIRLYDANGVELSGNAPSAVMGIDPALGR